MTGPVGARLGQILRRGLAGTCSISLDLAGGCQRLPAGTNCSCVWPTVAGADGESSLPALPRRCCLAALAGLASRPTLACPAYLASRPGGARHFTARPVGRGNAPRDAREVSGPAACPRKRGHGTRQAVTTKSMPPAPNRNYRLGRMPWQ